MTAVKSSRIASIDIFRSITMFLMLWVNDFAGMSGVPHWMKHAAMTEDMLGFSDLVFPAFLFCVGMSIPFAIDSRFRKGDSLFQVIGHILLRSLALIVMGLFSMNCGTVEGGLSHQWFSILMVIGFFLVWNVYPSKKWYFSAMKIAGVALLAFLVVHRIASGLSIRTGWWGILGLIGWAYLIVSLLYLLCRDRLWKSGVLFAVFVSLMLLAQSGVKFLGFYPGGWTHPAFVATGLFVSCVAREGNVNRKNRFFFIFALGVCVLMLSCGSLAHTKWICSKIMATPTWYFYCISIFVAVYTIIFYVADVLEKTSWARPIKAAGTATLTCYMLPTITYSVRQLLHLFYPGFLTSGVPGLLKSAVFAFVIIILAELLSRVNIKLKI